GFRPPSPERNVPSGKHGPKLAAYGCGGSRGIESSICACSCRRRVSTSPEHARTPAPRSLLIPDGNHHAQACTPTETASIDGGAPNARKGQTVARAPHLGTSS